MKFTFMNLMGGEDFEHCSKQMEGLYNGGENWIHYGFSKNTSLEFLF